MGCQGQREGQRVCTRPGGQAPDLGGFTFRMQGEKLSWEAEKVGQPGEDGDGGGN